MIAPRSFGIDVQGRGLAGRTLLREGWRYFLASAIALALDAGTYSALIRLGSVYYLAAAPIGFAIGVIVIYVLSTRWVFAERRLSDSRWEFLIFVVIGILGLLLNELVIFVGVERLALGYELAKLMSAATVFGFNFTARKILLFTRG